VKQLKAIETARAVFKLAAKKGLYSPIATEVVNLLNGQEAARAIEKLLISSKREEF